MKQAGYTLIEILVATAIMLTVTGGVFALLDDALGRSHYWNESADLHQRGRAAVDTLTLEIGQAGAGIGTGRLADFLPPIEPRRGTAAFSQTALTIRQIPLNGAWTTLTSAAAPGGGVVTIRLHSGCAAPSCGFAAGMQSVLYDAAGNWTPVLVDTAAGDTLVIVDSTLRTASYPAGAQLAQLDETVLYFDATQQTLRKFQPGGGDFPVVDNVVDISFEYLGDQRAPAFPRPPVGTANCLYDAEGARTAMPVLPAAPGAMAALPLGIFDDGPFCGSGATMFDVDLLRIRTVRARVRIQAGVEMLRGGDPRLFARPGTAVASARSLPDLPLQVDVSPASLLR